MKNRMSVHLTSLIVLVMFASCNFNKSFEKDGGIQLTVNFEGYSIDKYPEIDEILKNRLSFISKGEVEISRTSEGINIKVPGVYENEKVRIEALITSKGELGFWETYECSEILPYFEKVNVTILESGILKEAIFISPLKPVDSSKIQIIDKHPLGGDEVLNNYPIYKYLAPAVRITEDSSFFLKGPMIGTALFSDTSKINKLLRMQQVKAILPRDLNWAWTLKPVDNKQTYFQLIALKKSTLDGKSPLGNEVISKARVDKSRSGEYEVNIQMNAEGAKIWARFTKQNIGKSIAIVFDGFVYSYPTVQSEIKGGSSQITGNFTKEEAFDLCALIKNRSLPVPLLISKSEVVYKK